MTRPCLGMHKQLRPDKCRLCWLVLNRFKYAKHWGEDVLLKQQKIRSPLPCKHLGMETGLIPCSSCKGSVQVKTFVCAVHGECTLGKKVGDKACCDGCPDFTEASAGPSRP